MALTYITVDKIFKTMEWIKEKYDKPFSSRKNSKGAHTLCCMQLIIKRHNAVYHKPGLDNYLDSQLVLDPLNH